jgi:hypothetical protein
MVEDVLSIIEIAAPREQVWQTLTQPWLVSQWMGCLRFRPAAGHVFYLQPDRALRTADDVTGAIACRTSSTPGTARTCAAAWGGPGTRWRCRRLRRWRRAGESRLTSN